MTTPIFPIGAATTGADTTPSNPATAVVNVPTGTANGDVMVCVFVVPDGTLTPSLPVGWTQTGTTAKTGIAATDTQMLIGYRVASGEPASYTFSVSGASVSSFAAIRTYRGVNTTTPILDSALTNGASSTSVVAPSVNASVAGSALAAFFAQGDVLNLWTPPTGMTETFDGQVNPTGTANDITVSMAEGLPASVGTTGSRTATASGAAIWVAGMVALNPAVPGVSVVGLTTVTATPGASASASPALPTGWQAGDVAYLFAVTPGVLTTPTNYTKIVGGFNYIGNPDVTDWPIGYVYRRVLQGGDSNPTITSSASGSTCVAFTVLRGVNATPEDGTATYVGASATGTTIVVPTITPTVTGDALLTFCSSFNGGAALTGTPPSGQAELADVNITGSQIWLGLNIEAIAGTGATGSRTETISTTKQFRAGINLLVKAAASSTDATVSGSVVAAVASVPSATVATGSVTSPAVVSAIASVPAPSFATGQRVSAVTVAAVASVPAPSVSSGESFSVAVVAAVTSVPAPTATTGTGVSPAAIAGTATVPSPSLATDTNLSAVTVAALAAVPAPSLATNIAFTSAAVSAVAAVSSPAVATGTGLTAVVVQAVAAVGSSTVATGSVLAVSVVAATTSVPAPDVSADVSIDVSGVTVAAFASVPAPALSVGIARTAAVVAATASIPSPAIGTSSDVSVSPSAVAAVVSIPSGSTATGISLAAGVVSAVAVVAAPVISSGTSLTAFAVTAIAVIPTPAVDVQTAVTPATVQAIASIGAVQTSLDTSMLVAVVLAIASIPGAGIVAPFAKPNIDGTSRSTSAGSLLDATSEDSTAAVSAGRESTTVATIWEG